VSVRSRQLEDDPSQFYRDFHRTLGAHCYMIDIDSVELRKRNGSLVPVAFIETTYCNTINDPLLKAVAERLDGSPQLETMVRTASVLGVPAYIVVFTLDCEMFAVRKASGGSWHIADRRQYSDWIEKLPIPSQPSNERTA
jgi:hypothetical protein